MDLFKVFRQAYIKLSLACLSQGENFVHIDSEDMLSALNLLFIRFCTFSFRAFSEVNKMSRTLHGLNKQG